MRKTEEVERIETTNNWHVITAGPSAGKSSTIRELSMRGYRTAPEAARILFDQAISEGTSPEEKRQEDGFHEQVETIDRRIEQNLPDDEPVFLDRSLADNIAYRRHFGDRGRENTDAIFALCQECANRYGDVFLLDRIEFVDDEVRDEDEQEAQEIHEKIRRAYEDIGHDVYEIPVKPVDERAQDIENHIERIALH